MKDLLAAAFLGFVFGWVLRAVFHARSWVCMHKNVLDGDAPEAHLPQCFVCNAYMTTEDDLRDHAARCKWSETQ